VQRGTIRCGVWDIHADGLKTQALLRTAPACLKDTTAFKCERMTARRFMLYQRFACKLTE
jgi:hypothetical protein